MNIRPATLDDIPRIVEMAERFYPSSPYALFGPMQRESIAGLAIITMDSGVMLVADDDGLLVGMACIHVDHFLFNIDLKVGHELVFWIEPEYRGGLLAARMLKAIDAAVAARGAHINRMATLSGSPAQAGALYERMGYALTETYYSKRLN